MKYRIHGYILYLQVSFDAGKNAVTNTVERAFYANCLRILPQRDVGSDIALAFDVLFCSGKSNVTLFECLMCLMNLQLGLYFKSFQLNLLN